MKFAYTHKKPEESVFPDGWFPSKAITNPWTATWGEGVDREQVMEALRALNEAQAGQGVPIPPGMEVQYHWVGGDRGVRIENYRAAPNVMEYRAHLHNQVAE